jgi:hypothetical protein
MDKCTFTLIEKENIKNPIITFVASIFTFPEAYRPLEVYIKRFNNLMKYLKKKIKNEYLMILFIDKNVIKSSLIKDNNLRIIEFIEPYGKLFPTMIRFIPITIKINILPEYVYAPESTKIVSSVDTDFKEYPIETIYLDTINKIFSEDFLTFGPSASTQIRFTDKYSKMIPPIYASSIATKKLIPIIFCFFTTLDLCGIVFFRITGL